ncbi:aldose epimerase family protein [Amnibacterium kyonggiense]|uniref:Aldose 1-epimerase n=1 Tax=Amnibacterium kyonggiense TaxID=595671 RepID=A0A4R7FKF4_9MICO|nr:aldose epimerase family protein [Amnibacterium kyonggiense]TDS76819.1 aldose 1-epimerase [Amnibacterium kyonggiense]
MSAVEIVPFGTTRTGEPVERAVLRNGAGSEVAVLSLGAVLQEIRVPDRSGTLADVVLGFDELLPYETVSPYFGAIVGRYANRIADARFTLDGQEHVLDRNDPHGTVHGGSSGFHSRVWTMTALPEPAIGVRLELTSPHGDNGFPGEVTVQVDYELASAADVLDIRFSGTTDRPTVLNLTGHTYFNLRGEGSGTALDHHLTVDADEYLPVDESLVPVGASAAVAGTPFDLRAPSSLGDRVRHGHPQITLGQGIDHNFVLRPGPALRRAARLADPGSGRSLEVWTTEPGIDVYTGNFLDGSLVGKSGRTYRQGDAIALEPEHFTDSPNRPGFPSTVLRPGREYRSRTQYRFGVDPSTGDRGSGT